MESHSNEYVVQGCASGCGLAYNYRVPFNVHLHPGIHGRTLGMGIGPRHSHSASHLTLRTASTSSSKSYSGILRTASKHSGYDFSRKPCSDVGYSGSRAESYDSGLGVSGTASSDSACDGSSTVATSTCSTSHLVESYQKMSMHPLAEGKLRYARTGQPRTVDCVVCMCRTLPEPARDELEGH